MDRLDRSTVFRDLFVALSSVVTAALSASAVDPTSSWWAGTVAVVGSLGLFAAVDRSTVGTWILAGALTVAILAYVAVLWWLVGGSLLALVPLVLFGLGVGSGVNRLLFGVVYSLPEQRRAREKAA
jgi:apolipoprotein N-acyltransferase